MENQADSDNTQGRKFKFLPLTISLETLGGIATPLVLRGTPLPAKRSQVFSTASDYQQSVLVKVLMGESPIADENLFIAEFELSGIAVAPRGQAQIEVTFEVNEECQIKASAIEKKSGSNISVVTTDTQPHLSEDKIKELLLKAEANKERDQNRKETIEAKNRAEQVIRNAEAYLQRYQGSTFLSEEAKKVERALAALGVAIEENDGHKIQTLVNELESMVTANTTQGFDDFFSAYFNPMPFDNLFGVRRSTRGKSSARKPPSTQRQSNAPSQPTEVSNASKIAVLAVFANPRGSNPLRLGAEDRVIRESIQRSGYRDRFQLMTLHAATIHDVRRTLLEHQFSVIHFSGHGTGSGLAFEDELGNVKMVPPDALADLLSSYSPPIECVILNACYSQNQGRLLKLGMPYTIAAEGPISDSAATEFTRGFYDALGAGKSYEFAYQEGCRTVRLTGHPSSQVPLLLRKE